jgi:hypothetical protein
MRRSEAAEILRQVRLALPFPDERILEAIDCAIEVLEAGRKPRKRGPGARGADPAAFDAALRVEWPTPRRPPRNCSACGSAVYFDSMKSCPKCGTALPVVRRVADTAREAKIAKREKPARSGTRRAPEPETSS